MGEPGADYRDPAVDGAVVEGVVVDGVAPASPSAPGEQRRSALRIGVQTLAFILGLLLLYWCARQALAEENQEQIQRLGEASIRDVAIMAGLSVASITLNGLVFWAALLPVRRLSPVSVVATNALASFLNYLPFKLSILARVLIHTKRDRVPLLTIGAWFAVMAVVVLSVYGPLVGMSLWRRRIDWVWVVAGFGGVGAMLAMAVALGRFLRGERGLERLERAARFVFRGLGGPLAARLLKTKLFGHLHAGADMLASPRGVGLGAAFWLGDLGVQATRFVVAAGVLGVGLSWQDAVLVASCYFLIGVASPAGQLGTREAGTTALGGLLGLAGGADLAVVMLLASAVESLVSLLMAGAAIVWLRPDRLLWGNGKVRESAGNAGPREGFIEPLESREHV